MKIYAKDILGRGDAKTKDGKPLSDTQLRSEYFWVEDETGIVQFVGSKTATLSFYKKKGGERAGLHWITGRKFQQTPGEEYGVYDELPQPVVGEKINW